MPKKKTNKRRPRVSSTHTHEEPQQQQQRRPSPQSIMRIQKMKLEELDDRHVAACALVEDLEQENRGLRAMMQQIVAENQILRTRLGIAEGESVDLSDDEAATAERNGAKVYELPDREGQTPDGTEEAGQQSGPAGEGGPEEPVSERVSGQADHVGDAQADSGPSA